MARELTKKHEEHIGPNIGAVQKHFSLKNPQGECTLVLGGAKETDKETHEDAFWEKELKVLIAEGASASEAAKQIAKRSGKSRRMLYSLLHH